MRHAPLPRCMVAHSLIGSDVNAQLHLLARGPCRLAGRDVVHERASGALELGGPHACGRAGGGRGECLLHGRPPASRLPSTMRSSLSSCAHSNAWVGRPACSPGRQRGQGCLGAGLGRGRCRSGRPRIRCGPWPPGCVLWEPGRERGGAQGVGAAPAAAGTCEQTGAAGAPPGRGCMLRTQALANLEVAVGGSGRCVAQDHDHGREERRERRAAGHLGCRSAGAPVSTRGAIRWALVFPGRPGHSNRGFVGRRQTNSARGRVTLDCSPLAAIASNERVCVDSSRQGVL